MNDELYREVYELIESCEHLDEERRKELFALLTRLDQEISKHI